MASAAGTGWGQRATREAGAGRAPAQEAQSRTAVSPGPTVEAVWGAPLLTTPTPSRRAHLAQDRRCSPRPWPRRGWDWAQARTGTDAPWRALWPARPPAAVMGASTCLPLTMASVATLTRCHSQPGLSRCCCEVRRHWELRLEAGGWGSHPARMRGRAEQPGPLHRGQDPLVGHVLLNTD